MVPISPSFNALIHAVSEAKEAAMSPLPSRPFSHSTSNSTLNLNFYSASNSTASSSSSSPLHSSLTGLSILKVPPTSSFSLTSESERSAAQILAQQTASSNGSNGTHENGTYGQSATMPSTPSLTPTTHTLSTSSLSTSSITTRRNSTGSDTLNGLLTSNSSNQLAASSAVNGSSSVSSKYPSLFKRPKNLAADNTLYVREKKKSSESTGGSSCHQCKSRRSYGDLTYCTASLNKKNKNAVCRKKYCEHCLKKFYRESANPPGSNLPWKCPSCRKVCCCAACRRRENRDTDDLLLSPGSADVTMSPMAMTPMDGSPSPPAMNRLLLSPRTPQLSAMSPLPPQLLTNIKREDGNDTDNNNQEDTAAPLTGSSFIHSSPALTALSAAASSLAKVDLGTARSLNGSHRNAFTSTSLSERGYGRGRNRTFDNMNELTSSNSSDESDDNEMNVMDNDGNDSLSSLQSSILTSAGIAITGFRTKNEDRPRSTEHSSHSMPPLNFEFLQVLPSFSLFVAISALPQFKASVNAVLQRKSQTNTEKLKAIEDVFLEFAEKINSDELQLQL